MFRGTFLCLLLIFSTGFANDQVSLLVSKVQEGPSVYYSPEAYSYYTRSGTQLEPQAATDAVSGAFSAAIKLISSGDLLSVVPVLLEKFPQAIHVAEITNIKYSGEGSYDDWVQTYITNEKNKFILACPFLDYNSMSVCDQFIETQFQDIPVEGYRAGIREPKNIIITFTLQIGTCALTRLTGKTFGNSKEEWTAWWNQEGKVLAEVSGNTGAANKGITLEGGQSFSEIQFRGKYRMKLRTGDELVGVVEFLDDTSLILETLDGKPYTFSNSIISGYELLEAAKTAQQTVPGAKTNAVPAEIVTFDKLLGMQAKDRILEVTINNGSVFKGKLVSITNSELKLDIEGAVIPIQRSVVNQIMLSLAEVKKKDEYKGPFDTLYIRVKSKNGYSEENEIFDGLIVKEQGSTVVLKTRNGEEKTFNRSQINRVIKHSTQSFEEPIVKYAKPLFCPDDMFLVDMPPGKKGKPFFKVCVDRYEYPNRKGESVKGAVSFVQAKQLCESQGKRVCTAEEWQWACSGIEGYTYPYGWNLDENKCNRNGATLLESSGSRVNCVSKFGGYDMVGNIFEWVTNAKSEPALMGGPYTKCQTVSPGVGGGAKPQTGFRCCKSN